MAKHHWNKMAIGTAALSLLIATAGCASNDRKTEARIEKLNGKLRKANAQIENLRERNWILKSRIKMLSQNGGIEPIAISEPLKGFDQGMHLDVPIDSRRPAPTAPAKTGREDVAFKDLRPTPAELSARKISVIPANSERPTRLPSKRIAKSRTAKSEGEGERADRVLARTVVSLLKEGDFSEADRTVKLLDKSYPDSELVSESHFQIGLALFKKGRLQSADRSLNLALQRSTSQTRVKAGASLMRGIIAERLARAPMPTGEVSPVVDRNRSIAKRNFQYVVTHFPGTSEAKRARNELASLEAIMRPGRVR